MNGCTHCAPNVNDGKIDKIWQGRDKAHLEGMNCLHTDNEITDVNFMPSTSFKNDGNPSAIV